MYNCLYQYLTENKILYPKQFGLQTGHSTEHAINGESSIRKNQSMVLF